MFFVVLGEHSGKVAI